MLDIESAVEAAIAILKQQLPGNAPPKTNDDYDRIAKRIMAAIEALGHIRMD